MKEEVWYECLKDLMNVMEKYYPVLKDHPSYRFLYNALKCSLNSMKT